MTNEKSVENMENRFQIIRDDLTHSAVIVLLQEHLEHMAEQSPPESVHALDLDALRQPGISFWSVWEGDNLAGCGALSELDAQHGEIKSMRTSNDFRRRGIAALLLEYILQVAKERGYQRLSLETGSMEGFAPARKLYERFGFGYCEPFADYELDPHSVFMTREINTLTPTPLPTCRFSKTSEERG